MFSEETMAEFIEALSSGSPLMNTCGMVISVLSIIALWKIYKKAGERGWASLIPIYRTYVLFKITWGNGWKFLFLLIPFANIVFLIITLVKLAKVFGKSSGFAVGLIFLNTIFMCILGFGKSQYQGVPQSTQA